MPWGSRPCPPQAERLWKWTLSASQPWHPLPTVWAEAGPSGHQGHGFVGVSWAAAFSVVRQRAPFGARSLRQEAWFLSPCLCCCSNCSWETIHC